MFMYDIHETLTDVMLYLYFSEVELDIHMGNIGSSPTYSTPLSVPTPTKGGGGGYSHRLGGGCWK